MSSRLALLEPAASIIDREFNAERPDTIWALAPLLTRMVAQGLPAAALNHELEQIVADPAYDGNWPLNRVVLHRGRGITLVIRLINEQAPYIRSVPFYGIFVPLGTHTLKYDLYRLPSAYKNEVFDPNLKLDRAGTGETPNGGLLRVDPYGLIPDFQHVGPQLVLQLSTAPTQYLQWLFNRDSLLAWQANDSSMNLSQLRVAAYVLGKFAHQTSLEPLGDLSTHGHHAVRWTAIQGLGRISRSTALEKLQAAVNDPHPHVRRAAMKTLQQLQSKSR
jgi:hypothetical protein